MPNKYSSNLSLSWQLLTNSSGVQVYLEIRFTQPNNKERKQTENNLNGNLLGLSFVKHGLSPSQAKLRLYKGMNQDDLDNLDELDD